MTDQHQQQQAKVVQEILSAKTLYDVLGVSPQNMGNLRKAYLTTSVKVHPDKNQHPQATEAFQRVAEAWGTLSEDSARAEYDAELSGGARSTSNPQYAYDFERSHMPSFQEALFMFATVTTMFSGASGADATRSGSAVNAASDFVETLFWAQKLAEDRQQEDAYKTRGDPNDPNYNSQQEQSRSGGIAEAASKDPLTSGMALGSGLRAFASAQRAMGLKKSAVATEKAATTVQVAAMGASVLKKANENPAVQRTLERGQSALKNNPQIAKGFRASLKMAGSIIMAMQEAEKDAQQKQQTGAASTGGRR